MTDLGSYQSKDSSTVVSVQAYSGNPRTDNPSWENSYQFWYQSFLLGSLFLLFISLIFELFVLVLVAVFSLNRNREFYQNSQDLLVCHIFVFRPYLSRPMSEFSDSKTPKKLREKSTTFMF